ncbi:uncharacterized protein N0V89_002647 [Didymosphaeria variabile]|uniref:DUF6536 domain-containing protein n=1 Tax=Didymosphaeria variabile TaxID=1932322 RepID=A0A9W8XUJ3_9PLEO|nr:uncharacterized protein N0V89_002647 [Didymosphaeria variabile]KAJ4358068.1 hypothetical protein N0V89_002647 [Didymosphaeria variabile]
MTINYNYDRLPALHESQGIADYLDTAWRTDSSPEFDATDSASWLKLPSAAQHKYMTLDHRDTADGSSLNSFRTEKSSSSTSSGIHKFKDGWEKNIVARVRRKPLPRYMQGSIRKHPAAEIEPTRVKRGVWKDQLLVDRSLRGMSLLMSAFAIAMLVVVATHAEAFGARANKFTSSVGGASQDCHIATKTNTALLLVINVAATMVLGMSNTYQQILTSLQTSDLKHMLKKFGDSRVGTNSPWNINRKEKGKAKSWAAWLLLVCTSLPIHFLANSLIGPSYVIEPPPAVTFNETTYTGILQMNRASNTIDGSPISTSSSFLCWSSFRTGRASFPRSTMLMNGDLSTANQGGLVYSKLSISYAKENCSGLAGTWEDVSSLEETYKTTGYNYVQYAEGECVNSESVICTMRDQKPAQCRLNVRMNAAFVLAAALSIKAIYMIIVNFVARGHTKRQLLTFGDVIVASASHSELRVQGECMVNAKESYRRHCKHSCHKHCKSPQESRTGEEVGHCQKCKKWNSVDRFTNEIHPTIATKVKRSLISNLGNTALTQMTIMTFCSIAMVAASIAAAVPVGLSNTAAKEQCKSGVNNDPFCQMVLANAFLTCLVAGEGSTTLYPSLPYLLTIKVTRSSPS